MAHQVSNRPARCYTADKQKAIKKADTYCLRWDYAHLDAFLALCGCPASKAPKRRHVAKGCHGLEECKKWRGAVTVREMWAKQLEILLAAGFRIDQLAPRFKIHFGETS